MIHTSGKRDCGALLASSCSSGALLTSQSSYGQADDEGPGDRPEHVHVVCVLDCMSENMYVEPVVASEWDH